MNSSSAFSTANEFIPPWGISRPKNMNCIGKQSTALELEKNTCPILPNRYPLNLLWTKLVAVYSGHADAGKINEAYLSLNFDAYASTPLNIFTVIIAILSCLIAIIGLVKIFRINQLMNPVAITLSFLIVSIFGCFSEEVQDNSPPTEIMKHFEPFKESLDLRDDGRFAYIGSNGFPDHPMMVGIQSRQQQVPVSQLLALEFLTF